MAATPQAPAQRPLSAWRARLERFWRWWSGELLGLVPERLAGIAGSQRAPLLALEAQAVTVLEPRLAAGEAAPRVELADADPARAGPAVRALLERLGESRGRARVALAPHEALVRRVTMPAATEENLAMVLGFEMDRLTPFRAEEVCYDHRVIGRDAAGGTIAVLLAVARREVVEARLAQARALGLSVQGVTARDDAHREASTLDLLPRGERGEQEKPRERLVRQGLGILALLLLIAALVVPALSKRAEVHAIKPALDRAYAEAQATDALLKELDRLVSDHNFLLARRHATYPSLAYIEEVTRLLPDNTWLQQLELKAVGKGRELMLSGETVSSSKLIEIFEQSKLLQNTAPRGTVTRGTQPGTERFVIAAELRPRPQPEAVAVTEAPAPVAVNPAFAPAQAAAPAPAAAAPPSAPVAAAAPTNAPPAKMEILFKPRGKVLTPEELEKAQGR